MTSRIRFADALVVFDTFPQLERIAPRPGAPAEPLAYAETLLASPRPVAGLIYLSHLLPRREAVWWGCQCLGAVLGAKDEALQLAIRWVRDPDEATRREALAFIEAHGLAAPTSWLARAVGHSGGSLLGPEHPPMPPPADACALSVNAAIVLATTAQPPAAILPWMRACGAAGVRFAGGGDATVVAPSLR
jgi:hypothetical protein